MLPKSDRDNPAFRNPYECRVAVGVVHRDPTERGADRDQTEAPMSSGQQVPAPKTPAPQKEQLMRSSSDNLQCIYPPPRASEYRDPTPAAKLLAGPSLHPRGLTQRLLTAAISARLGVEPEGQFTPDERGEINILRAYKLQDLARESLLVEGGHPSLDVVDVVREALSGVSAPLAFGTAVKAGFVARFDRQYTPPDFCSIVPMSSFRQRDVFRVKPTGGLQPLPRGGVARTADVEAGESATYKLRRWARSGQFCEQDIIDDNVGLLARTSSIFASDTSRLPWDLTCQILLSNPNLSDGLPLFDASRGNTSSSALDSTTLGAACEALRTRTETLGTGREIGLDLRPTHLVCSPKLEETARKLLRDREVGGDRGGLKLVVPSQLQNGVFDPLTGEELAAGSQTWWAVVAFDEAAPCIEIGMATPAPVFRFYALDQGQYGIAFDVSWDVAATPLSGVAIQRGNS